MRSLKGKSARLSGVEFDKASVNTLAEAPVVADEAAEAAADTSADA